MPRYRVFVGCAAAALFLVVASAEARESALRLSASTWPAGFAASVEPSPMPQALPIRRLRVPDPVAYDAAKRRADAAAGHEAAAMPAPAARATRTAASMRDWEGIRSQDGSPSDSTSAIGTKRFVELINSRFAIFDRENDAPLSTGTLFELGGCLYCSGGATDPQVIWDAGSRRFYVVFLEVSTSGNSLSFAFSKGPSPDTAYDFCHYSLDFGAELPDYPKLGDTGQFVIIGANMYEGDDESGAFLGARAVWITKPVKGRECPALESFQVGEQDLAGGQTPVPANQIDRSQQGWIVATALTSTADFLKVYGVSRAADGTAVIDGVGRTVPVKTYSTPANAIQKSSLRKLDTLDGRNTQAVSALDPARGAVGLWTQHTVFGGAGAELRWYELDPAGAAVFQSGSISSGSLYVFNGAISPDRVRRAYTRLFGSNMVIAFNTSSSDTFPALSVASKVGNREVSAPVLVAASSGADNGFDCGSFEPCRWGDYAAVTPDPISSDTAARGRVWGTTMLAAPSLVIGDAEWRTHNFVIRP